jgi:hypothetical protein
MELFIPFARNDGRNIKERRLKITIDNNLCVISEEYKIRDTWYDDRDGYNTVDFPVELMLDLAEALQRMNKLLILK